jgi:hypothetical protein
MSGGKATSSRGFARIVAHRLVALRPLGRTSGCPALRMTAAMAARRRLLDGAVGSSAYGAAGLMNGVHGQPQGVDGFGPSGNVPSVSATPGQPGLLLSGVSSNSMAAAGKMRMT